MNASQETSLPVVVSVYHRIDHFRQCIEALQRNAMAKHTRLLVCSDAAACPEHEDAVSSVREYCRTIDGFLAVELHERDSNMGAIGNSLTGIEHALKHHGSTIYMEDDILTAPGFLEFMNAASRAYADRSEVFSITGYCPPIDIAEDYPYDAFFLPRFCAWGIAYNSENFHSVPRALDPHDVESKLKDRSFRRKLTAGGTDVADMLRLEMAGKINAYDARAMYHQACSDMVTVYPRHSLVKNAGHDGSGVHCGATDRFDVELWDKTSDFKFPELTKPDPEILKANWKFRSPPAGKRWIKAFKRTRFYRRLRGRA